MSEPQYCSAHVDVSLELSVRVFVEGRGHCIPASRDDPGDAEAEVDSFEIEAIEIDGIDFRPHTGVNIADQLSDAIKKILRSKESFIKDAEEALIDDLASIQGTLAERQHAGRDGDGDGDDD